MHYLAQLMLTLAQGAAKLPQERVRRHGLWVLGQMHPDGGFPGRQGPSDLYYTSFALRVLALCGMLDQEVANQVEGFLRTQMQQRVSVVDFFSFVFSALLLQELCGCKLLESGEPGWLGRVEAQLEELRRPLGGYASGPLAPHASTYHTFLVLVCREGLGLKEPQPHRVSQFLLSQQRPDGGFVDLAVMNRSGTNPTAAAVEALRLLGALSPEVAQKAAQFLLQRQCPEGGLAANTRVGLADTLSTFTGLWALYHLGHLGQVDHTAVQEYLRQVELPTGGFLAAVVDEQADVEYTFYGLGIGALMQLVANRPEES